jgi:putative CocE/NonD family hydrolase
VQSQGLKKQDRLAVNLLVTMFKIKREEISLFTRQGIRLDADVYRPESNEQFPILLMRQPYGRKIASTIVYAHPSWYAAQGYIVVIQDVRGRGTSEGKFKLFEDEIEDGYDTVEWLSQFPGSTGEVAMYGFSYQGMTQLYAAVHKPAGLKTICPAMIANDLYGDWGYENNAFCLQANLGWAIQLATESARLRGDEMAFQKLYQASRNLPLYDSIPSLPTLLQEYAIDSFYHTWLTHYQFDEYWQNLSPKYLLSDVDLPMLHIGGWFDPYLRGTINLYKTMSNRSKFPQHLIIGPWAHLPWGRKTGSQDYGKESVSNIDLIQVQWFDYFLKGKKSEFFQKEPVHSFEMGSNQWRYFNTYPRQNPSAYYLISDGLASIREESGKLQKVVPDTVFSAGDKLIHDPWRPVPALGGHAALPAGAFERSSLDCRTDVLTYTSEPLTEALYLAGDVSVEVYCRADTPSFDLSVVLSEVYPNGQVYNFSQGYIRIDSPQSPVRIPLQATCLKILPGNCLRLSLSAACFPAYPVNPGTGLLPHQTRLSDAQIITLTVSSGNIYPSQVLLPVVSYD